MSKSSWANWSFNFWGSERRLGRIDRVRLRKGRNFLASGRIRELSLDLLGLLGFLRSEKGCR